LGRRKEVLSLQKYTDHSTKPKPWVTVDSPDDYTYEGDLTSQKHNETNLEPSDPQEKRSSEPFVTVDNPDDFE
jgi:hypothetical protein